MEGILLKTKAILSRSAYEPLGNFDSAVLHIGGAGLHYPRDPQSKEEEPVGGWYRERSTGPFAYHRAQIKAPIGFFPHKIAEWVGLDGVWFDSHDVESYLRTKCLYLNGSSSSAVMEVDDVPESGSSPSRSESLSSAGGLEDHAIYDSESLVDVQRFAAFDDYCESVRQVFRATQGGPADELPRSRKKRVTINVDQLVERMYFPEETCHPLPLYMKTWLTRGAAVLNAESVCLGRTLGYKRELVDAALAQVLQEAW